MSESQPSRTFLLACFLAFLLSNCGPESDEKKNVQGYSPKDAVMNAAYNEARSTVGNFVAQLKSPKPGYRYLVKMRVAAQGQVEHIWLEPVQFENGVFKGPIANPFIKITSVKRGDVAQVKPQEISDWVVMDENDTVVAGGYTQKAMQAHPGIKPE